MRKFLLRATLVCVSVLIALGVGEVCIRAAKAIDPQILPGIYTYDELRRQVGSYWRPAAFNTFELIPNYRGQEGSHEYPGRNFTETINSLGLRGPETTLAKSPGVKRVLFLGDSMTFGLYIEDNETYPAVLQKLLNAHGEKIEILNGGYADGWCPDENLAWLIHRGMEFQPDLVVLGFYLGSRLECLKYIPSEQVWTAVDPHGWPTATHRKYQYVDATGRVRTVGTGNFTVGNEFIYRLPVLRQLNVAVLAQKGIDGLINRIRMAVEGDRDAAVLAMFNAHEPFEWLLKPASTEAMKQAEARFWLVADGMKHVASEHGAEFAVAHLPGNFEVDERFLAHFFPPSEFGELHIKRHFFEQEMEPILRAKGIPYIDVAAAMRDRKDQRFYPEDGEVHMNANGYAFTAGVLEPEVLRLLGAH